ncbi:hypothetical protein PV326_014435 [Microctonus aethiopoides]|nr:hypothetical protein PV326_014435 [Microctonus aethiopoides]
MCVKRVQKSGGQRRQSTAVVIVGRSWRLPKSSGSPSMSSTLESGELKPLFMCLYVRKIAEYDSEPDCIAHRVTVWGSAPLRANNNRSMPKSHWA